MTQDITQNPVLARVLADVQGACATIHAQGWAENHAGNLSYWLSASHVAGLPGGGETVALEDTSPELAHASFLVTGAGSPLRRVATDPARALGIITVDAHGASYRTRWGFADGGRPTSELPAHLLTHAARAKSQRPTGVVLHAHPTQSVAFTHVHELDERTVTRDLWATNTECLLAFPDGVAVLPWMVCGTREIARASAHRLVDTDIVLWAQHGVLAAAATLDGAIGIIESVEKAAQTFLLARDTPPRITDVQLRELAVAFDIAPREDVLR